MAQAGSILGNPVVRLEDPALLTGAAKYVDDLDASGAARIVFVRSSVAHGIGARRGRRGGAGHAGRARRLPRGGKRPGPAFVPVASDAARSLQSAGVRPRPGSLRRRHRGRRGGRVGAAGGGRRRSRDGGRGPAAGGGVPSRRPGAGRPAAVPGRGEQRVLRHRLRRRRGSARRCRCGRRGGDGEPAPGRRADGAQRLPDGAGRAAGRHHLLVSHQAPHSVQPALAAALGLEPERRASGVPVGGRRLRPEGRGVRRVPGGRGRRPATGPAGEVGRDPLRGHGGAGAGARLHHERQAGPHQRRPDRRARRQRGGVGRGLSGPRRGLADAHPDDGGRGLRHPEGALPGHHRGDQHHAGRRLPGRGPARGHPADRAGARRRRRPDGPGPGRAPAPQLPRSAGRSR